MSDEDADAENIVADEDGGGVLDQGDIDEVMAQASEDASGVVYRSDGTRFGSDEKVEVSPFDFRNPVFLTESEQRQLNLRHDKFTSFLAARLSLSLRTDFKLKSNELETIPYDKLLEKIENPAHIGIFRVEGLTGVGVVSVSAKVAGTVVNRMLGGSGVGVDIDRPLTDIEVGLFDETMQVILSEWTSTWHDFDNLSGSIVGTENDARYLQVAPRDAMMMVLNMDVQIGDNSGTLLMAFPYYMLQPIVKHVHQITGQFNEDDVRKRQPRWIQSYSDITVPIFAEWEANELSVRDVLSIKPGDVFEFPKSMLEQTQVRIMNTPCFNGEAGVDAGNVSVKIKNKLGKK